MPLLSPNFFSQFGTFNLIFLDAFYLYSVDKAFVFLYIYAGKQEISELVFLNASFIMQQNLC